MRFTKSQGLTESEKILCHLCERSFLRLWTYPNLARKPGKELTDLLVVFGDDVLIFSDKSCSYPNTGDELLDWQRWFRRAVTESARQINQAVRWIRNRPDQVFLDARCTHPLPLRLPTADHAKIHRICIAVGASERCRTATGHPGLAINAGVFGDELPFAVGKVEHTSGWLHVFDESVLYLLLQELDTARDFIDYLDAKENLLNQGLFQSAHSEADLLARYLWHGRSFPVETKPYVLEPNLWRQLERNPSFRAGREANRTSRFWDGLIEHFTKHYLDETLEIGNGLAIPEYEELARIMASEGRFNRRILSKAILERADRARQAKIGTLLPSEQPEVVYVLLIGQGAKRDDYAEYRADRSRELQLRCVAAKAAQPKRRYIVGIALDARGANGSSEDFCLIDTKNWNDEVMAGAARVREELQYFLPGKAVETQIDEREYPL